MADGTGDLAFSIRGFERLKSPCKHHSLQLRRVGGQFACPALNGPFVDLLLLIAVVGCTLVFLKTLFVCLTRSSGVAVLLLG